MLPPHRACENSARGKWHRSLHSSVLRIAINLLGRETGSEKSRHAEPCAVVREMQAVSQGHGSKENRYLLSDFHGPGAGPQLSLTLSL